MSDTSGSGAGREASGVNGDPAGAHPAPGHEAWLEPTGGPPHRHHLGRWWFAVAGLATVLVAGGLVAGTHLVSAGHSGPTSTWFWDATTTTVPETTTTVGRLLPPQTAPTVTTPRTIATTTTTEPQESGIDVTSLVGMDYSSDAVMRVMDASGCHQWTGLYMPGSYLNPGSGIDCEAGGLMIGVAVTSTTITDVGMVAGGYEDFSQFTGTLPLGLAWGMTRDQVEPYLEEHLGPAVDHFDPAGESTNWYTDDYTVTGHNYQGIQVQFNGTTEKLERVSVSLNAPTPWPR